MLDILTSLSNEIWLLIILMVIMFSTILLVLFNIILKKQLETTDTILLYHEMVSECFKAERNILKDMNNNVISTSYRTQHLMNKVDAMSELYENHTNILVKILELQLKEEDAVDKCLRDIDVQRRDKLEEEK